MGQRAARAERQHDKDDPHPADQRNPFEHDRDRVLYASSFRRLAGITQVASADERHLLHNRLTHSLKVAQLARRMAEYITRKPAGRAFVGLVDPDVAETAGLIHDMGHPPFGHAAEAVLDDLMAGAGGFEGNAQSFRIVTRLAARNEGQQGLNLTRATLDASLKYPSCRGCRKKPEDWADRRTGKKWGVYDDDLASFKWVRGADVCHDGGPAPTISVRSAEAILVDWADDVSYATHDIEDYYRAGLISLHDLAKRWPAIRQQAHIQLTEDFGASFETTAFDEAAAKLMQAIGSWPPYEDVPRERARIRTETNKHIMGYVDAIEISNEPPYVSIPTNVQYEVEVLKSLTKFFVINTPGLLVAQQGQTRIIETLYNELLAIAKRRPLGIPRALQDLLESNRNQEDTECRRAVCDYIASLTEAQAIDLHDRLTKANSGASIFGTWF